MQLPDFLSPEFHFLSRAANPEEAFALLKERGIAKEVAFYLECSDYTSWIKESGKELMMLIFTHFGEVEDEVVSDAKKILEATEKNYALYKNALPRDLFFLVEGEKMAASRFLFSAASPFFKKQIALQKNKPYVALQLSKRLFQFFFEFIYTGKIHLLIKEEPEFILDLTRQALKLEMEPLAECAGSTYKRYIDQEHLIETLKKARLESLLPIERACLDKINELNLGIHFFPLEGGGYFVDIHVVREEGEAFLIELKKEVRAVKTGELSRALLELPKIAELDISGSKTQEEELLKELPQSIVRLNLSDCAWLNDDLFVGIIKRLPKLSHLDISKNLQLTFRSFTALSKLQRLTSLSISNCRQIGDEEIVLIAESAPKLTHLIGDDLSFTDKALIDFGKRLSGLQELSLQGLSGITGEGFMELQEAFPYLEKLDLSRATGLNSFYIDKASKRIPIFRNF